jgi:hypothetical protein
LAGEWYDNRLEVHQRLARKIENLLEELLVAAGIQFHKIEGRIKDRKSFLAKAAKMKGGRPKYSAPTEQIKDVIGVRVITFLDSTIDDVAEIIKHELIVDPEHSIDKDDALRVDRVGYRSRHFVACLGGGREVVSRSIRNSKISLSKFRSVPCSNTPGRRWSTIGGSSTLVSFRMTFNGASPFWLGNLRSRTPGSMNSRVRLMRGRSWRVRQRAEWRMRR